MATAKAGAAPTSEVLGKVRRVVKRKTTAEDKADLDAAIHSLIEAQTAVERARVKAQKAASKLGKRAKALDAEIEELHSRWKQNEIEAVVECRVERTTTEILVIREDTGAVHQRRALTAEEHQALQDQLPHIKDAPKVHHPELDADGDVAKLEEQARVAREVRAELAKPVSVDEVLAQVDEDEEADDADEEPKTKKGKGGKGKGKARQVELFGEEGGGS